MEIRTLRYFLAVAELGNISKAAVFLHTSQPNITRQLKDLEAEIGKPLFKRGKGMILTEEGYYLKNKARQIIDLFDKIDSDIKIINVDENKVTGTIRIAGGESYAMNIIGNVFKKFHKKYPLVKLDIYSGATSEVIKRLEKGTIDFGILIEPAPITEYNFLKLPYFNTWGILMRKDSELANRSFILPEDLNGKNPVDDVFENLANTTPDVIDTSKIAIPKSSSSFMEKAQSVMELIGAAGQLAGNFMTNNDQTDDDTKRKVRPDIKLTKRTQEIIEENIERRKKLKMKYLRRYYA